MPRRSNNNRNERGLRGRNVDTAELRVRFLIVCEGERTEPNYFKRFPVASAYVEVIGEGMNTVSLVEKANELRDEKQYTEETDQVWCVFDKDDFAPELFNKAISMALASGLRVAYTNEAFELWYLLHYDYHDSALHRSQYYPKLTSRLKRKYKKNDGKMYAVLKDKQSDAIANAIKLYANHTTSPANDNPSTTVFLLVEELNKFLR